MSAESGASGMRDWRQTGDRRHIMVARVIAGLPLFVFGLAHIFVPGAAMHPLVEAAGLPAAQVLAPLGVATEVLAGASLLLGAWARIGAVLAIAVMAVAAYTHVAIETWPNPNEPPLLLPVVIILAAAYVLVRGAGRWSLDARATARG
ncbi:MAG: DoxX family protein [Dehalococcoidia bacterium]